MPDDPTPDRENSDSADDSADEQGPRPTKRPAKKRRAARKYRPDPESPDADDPDAHRLYRADRGEDSFVVPKKPGEVDPRATEALDEQRKLLDEIERGKEQRAIDASIDAEGKVRRAMMRIAAGIAFLAAVYGCTQIVGGDDDDAAPGAPETSEPVEQAEPEEPSSPAGGAGDTDVESSNPSGEAEEADGAAPIEDQAASDPTEAGIHEVVMLAQNACGGLGELFLRIMVFNNWQMTVDQLSTRGGNSFQSATGWSNGRVGMATLTAQDFYEVWFFIWNLGELLAVYNVYGPVPIVDPPQSREDLAAYGNGADDAEELGAAIGADPDADCITAMDIAEVTKIEFPEANS